MSSLNRSERIHANNLNAARALKEILTRFERAEVLDQWKRKSKMTYRRAVMFHGDDKDLIKGLVRSPSTFSPIPIGETAQISRALGWLLDSAQDFEARNRELIEANYAEWRAERDKKEAEWKAIAEAESEERERREAELKEKDSSREKVNKPTAALLQALTGTEPAVNAPPSLLENMGVNEDSKQPVADSDEMDKEAEESPADDDGNAIHSAVTVSIPKKKQQRWAVLPNGEKLKLSS